MATSLDRQLLLGLRPEGVPSFDNFVVGGNGELVQRLRTLSGSEHIYLWGDKGSGRSHLLSTIAAVVRELGERSVSLVQAADIDDTLALPMDALLLVDNVDALTPAGQAAMFRVFIAARERKSGLVLTGPLPPLQLTLREDLRTRIGQMLIYEIKSLDDEAKAAALHRHAEQHGLPLDDAVVRYLLQHGRRDLPSLLSMLDKLDEISLARQRPPTLPLLRELLLQAETK